MVTIASAPARTSLLTGRTKNSDVSTASSRMTASTVGSSTPCRDVPAACAVTLPAERNVVSAAAI
jgi:hypothetical protein